MYSSLLFFIMSAGVPDGWLFPTFVHLYPCFCCSSTVSKNSLLSATNNIANKTAAIIIYLHVKLTGFCFEAPVGPSRSGCDSHFYRCKVIVCSYLSLALTQLARDSSTSLFNTCRSYFAPIINTRPLVSLQWPIAFSHCLPNLQHHLPLVPFVQ